MAVLGKIFRVHTKYDPRDRRAHSNFGVHNLSSAMHAACSSVYMSYRRARDRHLSRENSNIHVYHYDCSAFAKIIFSIGCSQSILDVKQREWVASTNPLLFIASWGLDCKNFAAGALEVGWILPIKNIFMRVDRQFVGVGWHGGARPFFGFWGNHHPLLNPPTRTAKNSTPPPPQPLPNTLPAFVSLFVNS